MEDMESKWDSLLKINTAGRDDLNSDQYRYPYEPTPYSVLERLAESGLISEQDTLLDYGCGKGRADFFLSYKTGACTIGIEYDERIYNDAVANNASSVPAAKAQFVLARAEEYEVPHNVTRCYFFNPFSVEILHKVMARLITSYYENPREIFLFFYYPSDEYVSRLMTISELEFYDEIECEDLFGGSDTRERIMIFTLPCYDTVYENIE